MLRVAVLAGAIGLTAALAGCSNDPDSSASAGQETVVPDGKIISTSFGKYRQSTITDKDPAWELPAEIVGTDVRAKYSAEQIEDAYRAVLTFTAEEGIDSALNGEGQAVDEWWAKHKDSFHPDNQPEMLTSLEQGKAVVQREPWQEKDYEGYSYIYDSSPRVLDRTIDPDALWLASDGSIAVRMDVQYTMNVVPGIGESGDGRQVTNGFMTYSIRETDSGQWGITSFMHNLNTFPG